MMEINRARDWRASGAITTNLIVAIPATTKKLIVELGNVLPVTDPDDIVLTYSTDGGSTYASSGYGYAGSFRNMNTGGSTPFNSSSAAYWLLAPSFSGSNWGGAIQVEIPFPALTSAVWRSGGWGSRGGYYHGVAVQQVGLQSECGIGGITTPITHIKIAGLAGNLAADWVAYGLR